ncbi:MAG TPA: HD domain-containing protein [Oscillospiraceae bacterium]|nr:HD domain-containing protein [Oscillospiraceae bacterium]HXK77124.1 HD domain-containing protein [Oscillospiraceae bacterium]
MLTCMDDSAHDKDHVYRVLYVALDIAGYESSLDYDVLICACLLHDIGRREQFENPQLCHAAVGAEKAYAFLVSKGFEPEYAEKVKACIKTHRFRSDSPPQSIEAKILFDADKIDVTGTLGIARTIFYKGQLSEPLYSLLPDGQVSDGSGDTSPSFFQEYKYKLENLYTRFYTNRGAEIAAERRASAKAFYENMLREVQSSYKVGQNLLLNHID